MQGLAPRRRMLVLPLAVILVAAGLVLARSRVSEGATAGTISTYVGTSGCPGGATIPLDVDPRAVVFDGAGNLFIGQPTSILRVDRFTKAVTQVPGTYSNVQELAIDGAGNLYVLDGPDTGPGPITPPRQVQKVTPAGAVSVVVAPIGNNHTIPGPVAMAVSLDGVIYLGGGTQVIKEAGAGLQVVVNQSGAPGKSGDGGLAINAELKQVSGLAVDTAGNIYVADKAEGRVRRVSGGMISTVAGGFPYHNGSYPIPANSDFVASETMAAYGSELFMVEADRHQVVKLSGSTLHRVAGNGGSSDGCFGDGGPATSAELNLGQGARSGADVDPTTGDLYIADDGNNRVRMVAAVAGATSNGRGNAWGYTGEVPTTTTPTTAPPTTAPPTTAPPTTAPPTTAPPTTAPPTTTSTTQPDISAPPVADFTAPAVVKVGTPVPFTNTSTNADSYSWNFDDGSLPDASKDPVHVFTAERTYSVTLTAKRTVNGKTSSVTKQVVVKAAPEVGSSYNAITPKRVLDTRAGVGAAALPIAGGTSIDVDVATPLGLAPDQLAGGAVALNVTGILPTNQTYIQVYPSGEPRPLSSNLNLVPNQTLPNMVISKVGANGKVSVFNAVGSAQVAVDLVGYFPKASDFNATTPTRVLDTRPGVNVGAAPARVGPGGSVVLDLNGHVPSNAGSVVLNVTAINASAESYVSVFPANEPQPFVSNLNFARGETTANLVVVKLDSANQVKLFNAVGQVDLAADLMGWIPEDGHVFTGLPPARIYDSRSAGGPLGPGQVVKIDLRGRGGLPDDLRGVVLNVTAADISGESFVTVYPGDEAFPGSSNLYLTPGDVVPNLVISKVGADGTINVLNAANTANIIIDVMGYMW